MRRITYWEQICFGFGSAHAFPRHETDLDHGFGPDYFRFESRTVYLQKQTIHKIPHSAGAGADAVLAGYCC